MFFRYRKPLPVCHLPHTGYACLIFTADHLFEHQRSPWGRFGAADWSVPLSQYRKHPVYIISYFGNYDQDAYLDYYLYHRIV